MIETALDSDLRDLYQDLILDHGKHPRNFRVLEKADFEALGHNPLCGDRLMLYLTVGKDNVIQNVAFQGSGCAISVASASMMTEMLKGKTLREAETLFNYMHGACTGVDVSAAGVKEDDADRVQALSGVRHYPMRVKCATLAWHTLQAALKNEKKHGMNEAALKTANPDAMTAAIAATAEKILEKLRTVHDPEIPVNIYDLGLIYKIDLNPIEGGKFDLHIDMTLTTPGCPVAGSMPGMVEQAVQNLEELNDVKVNLVWDPPWDKSRMTDEAKLKLNMF